MDGEITDKKAKHQKKSAEKRERKRSGTHSSSETDSDRRKKRKNHHKEKKKKRHGTPSTSSATSSESEGEKKRRKLKRKQRKEAKKLQKELKKKNKPPTNEQESPETNDIPIALMETSKGMAPMTKDEWEKKQSVIRKVYDEQTGRHRLIKGDGEVIEEIVSKERHEAINRQATKGDANYFQTYMTANMSKQ